MHREIDFENDIEQALTGSGGYEKGDPNAYSPRQKSAAGARFGSVTG